MTNIEVIEASIDDLSKIVDVWDLAGLTRPWNNPQNDVKNALNCDSSTVLIAKLDNNIIGTAVLGYDGHRGWIYYLAVDPAHQGKGFGVHLYSHAEKWLINIGAPKIQILIRADNDGVISFYERLGFDKSSSILMGKNI